MTNSKSKQRNKNSNVNFWAMVQNVLIASMNKGQFGTAFIGLICMLLIFKMPPKDVSELVFNILDMLKTKHPYGYIAAIVVTGSWFFHSKWQRRSIDREMNRISEERNKYQERSLGKTIKSSEEK